MKIGLKKARLAITPSFVISTGAKRSGEICGFPHLAQRARQIWGTLDWWPETQISSVSAVAFLSVIPVGNLLLLCLERREWEGKDRPAAHPRACPERIFASCHIHVIVKIEDAAEVL
jgi:hypothetical protein